MKRISQLLGVAGCVSVLLLSAGNLMAQQDNPSPGGPQGGRGGRGGGRGGGFGDPAQMMENLRAHMDVKDDAEWKIIEERAQKVMDARREIGFGGGGMARLFRRPGADNGDQGGGRRRGFGPEPSEAEQALEKAIDSKASKDQLKTAMAKVRDEKKQREAKLTAAQEELRKVLSTPQEAVALSIGLVK